MKDLTIEQVHQAIVEIILNASELVEDAEVLFRAGKAARAYGLAYFACEEMGKLPEFIRAFEMLLSGRKVDWRQVRRTFRNHETKALNSFTMAKALDLFVPPEGEDLTITPSVVFGTLNAYHETRRSFAKVTRREEAFYCDLHNKEFRRPSAVITPNDAQGLITIARTQVRAARTNYVGKSLEEVQTQAAATIQERQRVLTEFESELDALTPLQKEEIAKQAGIASAEIPEVVSALRAFIKQLL